MTHLSTPGCKRTPPTHTAPPALDAPPALGQVPQCISQLALQLVCYAFAVDARETVHNAALHTRPVSKRGASVSKAAAMHQQPGSPGHCAHLHRPVAPVGVDARRELVKDHCRDLVHARFLLLAHLIPAWGACNGAWVETRGGHAARPHTHLPPPRAKTPAVHAPAVWAVERRLEHEAAVDAQLGHHIVLHALRGRRGHCQEGHRGVVLLKKRKARVVLAEVCRQAGGARGDGGVKARASGAWEGQVAARARVPRAHTLTVAPCRHAVRLVDHHACQQPARVQAVQHLAHQA